MRHKAFTGNSNNEAKYFGHIMWKEDSLEKSTLCEKMEDNNSLFLKKAGNRPYG